MVFLCFAHVKRIYLSFLAFLSLSSNFKSVARSKELRAYNSGEITTQERGGLYTTITTGI